ncbi:MAG: purine-nucleoside phosphorylase, partial [Clostridiales bacterium]|nr:purine-nucleoside phosphorylase [Clostridiales bacterium]
PNIEEFGPRFPDMCEIYSKKHIITAIKSAEEIGLPIEKGVYCFAQGPQYETPAEIRAMRILGADAVGMSTVPEAVAANHAGMNTLGISCITNMAAGMLDKPLSHAEVMETTERIRGGILLFLIQMYLILMLQNLLKSCREWESHVMEFSGRKLMKKKHILN